MCQLYKSIFFSRGVAPIKVGSYRNASPSHAESSPGFIIAHSVTTIAEYDMDVSYWASHYTCLALASRHAHLGMSIRCSRLIVWEDDYLGGDMLQ